MLPIQPLKPQAQKLFDKIRPKIKRELENVANIPVGVLIWGPGPDSLDELAKVRLELRSELREAGHLAMFSEELVEDPALGSVRVQQYVQAKEFDVIVSLPSTPGSIGELHDFANDSRVNSKILVCINSDFMGGYSNQSISALCTVLSLTPIYYDGLAQISFIKEEIHAHIQRLREYKYIIKGKS